MRNPTQFQPTVYGGFHGLVKTAIAVGGLLFSTGWSSAGQPQSGPTPTLNRNSKEFGKMEKATFGGGCFWCTEAVYQQLRGVHSVVSGYTGGSVKNPTYEQVCLGRTGHAEAIELTFDPGVISYEKLVEVHLRTHDPTTLNRQGADTGTQYRSAIFYHDEEQQKIAQQVKDRLDQSKMFDRPIVTEISPASTFYAAEAYHQDFFNSNPNHRYCDAVVREKVEKVRKLFKDDLK